MKRPDGDHAGLRSMTLSFVSQVVALEDTSTTSTSDLVFWIRRNTMCVPSGDHRGVACTTASELSPVTCCGLRPAESVTQIRRGPAHAASKASRAPSGEYDGLKAFGTTSCPRPDATSIVQTSPPSAYHPSTSLGSSFPAARLARTNAIRLPSGDQLGWMSSCAPTVNCRSSPDPRRFTNSFL